MLTSGLDSKYAYPFCKATHRALNRSISVYPLVGGAAAGDQVIVN
jgi:hypothetical protein